MSKTAIVIPARYGSTRFPGKPLIDIAGKTMLQRVCELAAQATQERDDCAILVATDDERILAHSQEIGYECVMTPQSCQTGSDRVMAAIKEKNINPDFIINLQGDAPFTPPSFVEAIIERWESSGAEVITPVVQLDWAGLDRLRAAKEQTPFSGTTCIRSPQGHALWFSKNIIPAIRDEQELRKVSKLSPVFQHIGLYGYRTKTLGRFINLDKGHYETLEGLEQLRFLENGIAIDTVVVATDEKFIQAGIDSPEDLKRANSLLEAM
jgi:3-deoxy-manno-octulosonate cytidylyltransferase (CMP-KDO synthetase)